MNQTDKKITLIARVMERIFTTSAASWPSSQYRDLVEKSYNAGIAYAEFMFHEKDVFKDIPTEGTELIAALDELDTRLMALDEKTGVHFRLLIDAIDGLTAAVGEPRPPAPVPNEKT